MTKDELFALADRVEALTGPDREIDKRVKAAIYGGVVWKSPFNGEWCLYREWSDDPKAGRVFERPRHVSHGIWMADGYTASLDAALTLVPEGLDAAVSREQGRGVACVYAPDAEACGAAIDYNAATPALALTAAALRAQAAALEVSVSSPPAGSPPCC